MTAERLAACLAQVVSPSILLQLPDSNSNRIVGLFEESTGIFVFLEQLLAMAKTRHRRKRMERSKYCFQWIPPPPPPPPTIPWWRRHYELWIMMVLLPVLAALLYYNTQTVLESCTETTTFLFQSIVQMPLKDLYRHGPWFLGWEGESLPAICARITYHGDYQFWHRNIEECLRIYAAKEEAWLKMTRPVVYVALGVLVVFIVRLVLWEWRQFHHYHNKNDPPPPTDRDMVDTYRAFQVILRQVRRNLAPGTQQEPRGAAAGGGEHRVR